MPPNFNPRDHFNDDDDGDDYKHDDINQIYHEWSTSSTTIGRNIPTSTVGAAATPVATDSNSRTDSGIITDATVVSLQPDQGVNPVAVLVPVFAGVAVLVLLMGCFFFWRRRRAAAAAAALAAAGAGAGAVYTEKYGGPEIPPRYEDSVNDRSVSVSSMGDPFGDPVVEEPAEVHVADGFERGGRVV